VPPPDVAEPRSKSLDRALSLVAAFIVVAIIVVAYFWFGRRWIDATDPLIGRPHLKVSNIDHVPITENCNSRIMTSNSNMLAREELASLLTVGSVSAVLDPLVAIPAEHSARLIGLEYMVDLAGKLRMTTQGRRRIATAFDDRPPSKLN
jgi:hypothetical protein